MTAAAVRIVPAAGAADERWLSLRCALWPDAPADDHARGMADAFARRHFVRLALDGSGRALGFVEASLRTDYVNGTDSSPVGFLEGLYVESAFRRRGFARALVAAATEWAAAEGCAEFASDAGVENIAAHAVHRALGFAEVERVVYFHKSLE
jgi:aminoglycoside 6'-N-acetyltransferase I